MQKVISINLNGNAYQLDETGYDELREYLARADRDLSANPDRAEIMADLEQAIADKCQKYLGPHKSVVNAAEVEQIVNEMGPINAAPGEDTAGPGDAAAGARKATPPEPPQKRLYRNPDGAMIAGVCNGLAAYFGIDVTIVRVIFVLLAVLTKGAGLIVYVVMMFIIPEAHTPEERAAAGGAPFNAKEVVERAKKQYADGTRHWRRQWRQHQRQWRRQGWAPGGPFPYAATPLTAMLQPFFALAHVALFLLMAAAMISLVNTGAILRWELPPNMPVWAGALILLAAYQIAASPIRGVQHGLTHVRVGGPQGWYAFWNAVSWLTGAAVLVWVGSNHIPEIREFVQRMVPLIREFAFAVRDMLR